MKNQTKHCMFVSMDFKTLSKPRKFKILSLLCTKKGLLHNVLKHFKTLNTAF